MPYFRALWLIFILVTTWLRFGYSPFITYFYFFIIGYKEVTNWLQRGLLLKNSFFGFFLNQGELRDTTCRAIARERIASRELTQDELYFKLPGRGQSCTRNTKMAFSLSSNEKMLFGNVIYCSFP